MLMSIQTADACSCYANHLHVIGYLSVLCRASQLLKCGDVVLWEVLGPNRFRVHLFRAGLHETDAALRATLPGGARCGPFYSGKRPYLSAFAACAIRCGAFYTSRNARLFSPLLLVPVGMRCQFWSQSA